MCHGLHRAPGQRVGASTRRTRKGPVGGAGWILPLQHCLSRGWRCRTLPMGREWVRREGHSQLAAPCPGELRCGSTPQPTCAGASTVAHVQVRQNTVPRAPAQLHGPVPGAHPAMRAAAGTFLPRCTGSPGNAAPSAPLAHEAPHCSALGPAVVPGAADACPGGQRGPPGRRNRQ